MNKPVLRRQLREQLANVDPVAARDAARRVTSRLLNLPEIGRARGVLVCLSFGVELDTWHLVDALIDAGIPVYVPRIVHHGHRLLLHRYPCPLETIGFGLQQPPADHPCLAPQAVDATVDVALILGLAFDHDGYRLGHGGGYFDRFLAGRPILTVGLGYEFQVHTRLPREAHDVPMTMVVTDACVRRPKTE